MFLSSVCLFLFTWITFFFSTFNQHLTLWHSLCWPSKQSVAWHFSLVFYTSIWLILHIILILSTFLSTFLHCGIISAIIFLKLYSESKGLDLKTTFFIKTILYVYKNNVFQNRAIKKYKEYRFSIMIFFLIILSNTYYFWYFGDIKYL